MTGNGGEVCVIFLFNHKFERNIAKLEAMYQDRFSNRHYIMPFASINDPKVSKVYELSWNFSGHIAQSARDFIDPRFSHYVFVADDLILNPALNESNIVEQLGLNENSGYIKNLAGSDSLRYRWPWAGETAMSLRKFGRGFDYRSELPSAEEARTKFVEMGFTFDRPVPRSLRDVQYNLITLPRKSPWAFLMGLGVAGRSAEFPLLSGYSDFLVVPGNAMERFAHYCGVFSAMNIFAEVAVPTALALAAEEVRTELEYGEHFMDADARQCSDIALKGVELWAPKDISGFAAQFGGDRQRLLQEFPPNWLYVHPVKLSAFK